MQALFVQADREKLHKAIAGAGGKGEREREREREQGEKGFARASALPEASEGGRAGLSR
jgi:hypothetical protein